MKKFTMVVFCLYSFFNVNIGMACHCNEILQDQCAAGQKDCHCGSCDNGICKDPSCQDAPII